MVWAVLTDTQYVPSTSMCVTFEYSYEYSRQEHTFLCYVCTAVVVRQLPEIMSVPTGYRRLLLLSIYHDPLGPPRLHVINDYFYYSTSISSTRP